jgi:hypothetical protein
MERVARTIGIGLVLVGFCFAVVTFQRTMAEARPVESATYRLPIEEEIAAAAAPVEPQDRSGLPPRYLAFAEDLPSGFYDVSDEPGSRDRDVAPRQAPAGAYPPETDIVPHESLNSPGSLGPGLYATTFGVKDCAYELWRVNRSGAYSIIGSDRISTGRMLVTINQVEPDVFNALPQCGVWSPWSPLTEPLVVAGNGDYWIGDLASGSWSVPAGCTWEKVVGFRGAELVDVSDSGVGPDESLQVDEATLGVRIRGCSDPFRLQAVAG